MRIAIVALIRNPIAEPFAGGMESYTWWLAKRLIDRGHQVTLLASGDSDARLGLVPICERSLSNCSTNSFADEQLYSMSAYASAVDYICAERFDVVHNNALHLLPLLSIADIPVSMVMTVHAPLYDELAAALQYVSARAIDNRLMVTAVFHSIAREWNSVIKTTVVHNGIDVDSWPCGEDPTPNLAVCYGRLVLEKGIHLAIRAALRAGYQVQVAGPVSDQDYFREQLLPLFAHKDVDYLGHLSHKEIKDWLPNASVFVNAPTWEEPYGMVYAEALASGTPIAAFNRGAVAEIVDETSGVLAAEDSVEALAGATQSARELSRLACRRRAETFCHLDVMVAKYEQLYRCLIKQQQT